MQPSLEDLDSRLRVGCYALETRSWEIWEGRIGAGWRGQEVTEGMGCSQFCSIQTIFIKCLLWERHRAESWGWDGAFTSP